MVTKVLTNYARVLMFLEDLVSLPEDCGQNSDGPRASSIVKLGVEALECLPNSVKL